MPPKFTANSPEPADMTITPPAVASRHFSKIGPIVLFILALLFLGSTTFYYRESTKLKRSSEEVARESVMELVNKVSQLIVLPAGETPTVATVTDPEKLKAEQAFFANASLGDKILIYTVARKAFMYSPKLNRLIEVAPIMIGTPNSQPTPIPPPTPEIVQPPEQTPSSTGTP